MTSNAKNVGGTNSTGWNNALLLNHFQNLKIMSIIALIPMTVNVDLKRFARKLSKTQQGQSTMLTSENICTSNQFVAQAVENSPLEKMLEIALEHQETNADKVFYLADDFDSNWTKRCIQRAKKVLLIGEIQNTNVLTPVGEKYYKNHEKVEMDLVLEYPNDNRLELDKNKWITPQHIMKQYHITAFNEPDFEMLNAQLIAPNTSKEKDNKLQFVKDAA